MDIYLGRQMVFVNKQDELPVTYNNAGISSYLNNGDKSTFYKPGDYKFIDVNGDGIISEEDGFTKGVPYLS